MSPALERSLAIARTMSDRVIQREEGRATRLGVGGLRQPGLKSKHTNEQDAFLCAVLRRSPLPRSVLASQVPSSGFPAQALEDGFDVQAAEQIHGAVFFGRFGVDSV